MRVLFSIPLCLAILASYGRADDHEDAEQLKDEATETIRANATKTVPPKDYAMAIYRLEKAQSIMEKAGETNSSLAQEINSGLFWTRRCSNVQIVKELEKIHAENPPLKLASREKPKRKMAEGDAAAEELDAMIDAKTAFEEAQEFAQSHSGDDYMISLRYFQMANEYPGTDYSMKAMTLARDAQIRFAIKTGSVKEELADTPEMKPVRDGDALVEAGKIEQAFELYKQSYKIKDNVVAHRRLGLAYFRRAQQMKDDINPKYAALQEEFKQAYAGAWTAVSHSRNAEKVFNANYPPWVAAKKKYQSVAADSNQAMLRYLYAQWEFEKVLKMATNNKDFDAAAYIGISLSARPESKSRAQQYLATFMKSYEPANDIERFIFEYCKTELDRVNGK